MGDAALAALISGALLFTGSLVGLVATRSASRSAARAAAIEAERARLDAWHQAQLTYLQNLVAARDRRIEVLEAEARDE